MRDNLITAFPFYPDFNVGTLRLQRIAFLNEIHAILKLDYAKCREHIKRLSVKDKHTLVRLAQLAAREEFNIGIRTHNVNLT